jgi:outer membrane lipoprotein LolB
VKWLTLPALAAALTTGCSTLTPPPVVVTPRVDSSSAVAPSDAEAARWTGHLSLKLSPFGEDGARGTSLSFDLQGRADQGALDLSTPFGTLVASVRWQPGQASLHTTDGVDSYASLNELITRVLGESLPVPSLMTWLKGRPDATLPFAPLPTGFEQVGWRVDTSALVEGILTAQRTASPEVRGATLRLRLDR